MPTPETPTPRPLREPTKLTARQHAIMREALAFTPCSLLTLAEVLVEHGCDIGEVKRKITNITTAQDVAKDPCPCPAKPARCPCRCHTLVA